MVHPYWQQQKPDQPLFPDLLWSRPERRTQAGKLLIIGGNLHGLVAPAQAYMASNQAGIGTARVLLPASLQKTVGKTFDVAQFVPTTPSGSFSQAALADLLTESAWADGVLLAGDFGRNAETAGLLETFVDKYSGPLTLTGDSVDYFLHAPARLLERPQTTLAIQIPQLQKIASSFAFAQAFLSTLDLLQLVDRLHTFSTMHAVYILTHHQAYAVVSAKEKVSTTKLSTQSNSSLLRWATYGSVWWLQNRDRPFEALTTALYEATV